MLTKDGRRVTGVPKNEDNFSIQLMDQQEQIHLLLKKDLKEIIHKRESLMPAYDKGKAEPRAAPGSACLSRQFEGEMKLTSDNPLQLRKVDLCVTLS